MKISELREKLNVEVINEVYDKEVTGVFISDMVSDIIGGAAAGNVLVTVQTHKNVIAAANLVDIPAIIITQNNKPSEEMISMANKTQITLFSIGENGWKVAQKLYEAGLR